MRKIPIAFFPKKYLHAGFYIATAVSILFGVLSYIGFFDKLEGIVYDRIISTFSTERITPSDILLVELDEDDTGFGDERWIKAFQILREEEVKDILIYVYFDRLDADFKTLLKNTPNVYAVQHVNSDSKIVRALPRKIEDYDLPIAGVIGAVKDVDGSYRKYYRQRTIEHVLYKSAIYYFADEFSDKKLKDSDVFRINFLNQTSGVPKISFSNLIGGNYISSLIEGKIVLIGVGKSDLFPGIITPIHSVIGEVSPMELDGFALQSLLDHNIILDYSPFLGGLVILLFGYFGALFYQRMSFQWGLLFGAILSFMVLLLAVLSVLFPKIWIPVTEIIISQQGLFFCIYAFRYYKSDSKNKGLLRSISVRIKEVILPKLSSSYDDVWNQIMPSVQSFFALDHVCLFIGDGFHVDDIVYKNKWEDDYVLNAANLGKYNEFVKSNDRLLRVKVNNLSIYTQKIVHSDEIQGFLVFYFEKTEDESMFSNIEYQKTYSFFLNEISQYIYSGSNSFRRRDIPFWDKILVLKEEDEFFRKIYEDYNLVEDHFVKLKNVYDQLKTSVIYYDLFGRVVDVNLEMSKFFKRNEVFIYQMSIVDMVYALTGVDRSIISNDISSVLVSLRSVSYSMKRENESGSSYAIIINPLKKEESYEAFTGERAIGILVEIIDISEIKKVYQLKEDLYQFSDLKLRQDLSSLLISLEMIEGADSQDKEIVCRAEDVIQRIYDRLDSVEKYLRKDIFHRPIIYPIPAKNPIENALRSVSKAIHRNRLEVIEEIPGVPDLVLADMDQLSDLCSSILEFLIQDSPKESSIKIELVEKKETVRYTFSNDGYGMSFNEFRDQIKNKEEFVSESMKKMIQGIDHISYWGGEFKYECDIGVGFNFTINLKRVLD